MAMPPNEIGNNGQAVRDDVQDQFNQIDANMLDPVYVAANNKITVADQTAGMTLKYIFVSSGYLNAIEISTIIGAWIDAGWTTADCNNNVQSPHDSIGGSQKWTLIITYTP